ncbi:hypothetical protein Peur_002643 [Populus x canadensis]
MKGQRSSPRTRNGGDAKNIGYSLPVAFLFFYTRQMPPVAILLGYECSLKEETTNVSTTFHTTISIMTRGKTHDVTFQCSEPCVYDPSFV